MKEADGNEVGAVRGCERCRRRGKWRIVALVAVLLLVVVAAGVFYFRQQGLREQLRALAGESGLYQEEVRGPGWYVRLADKHNLPALKRPVRFLSNTMTDEDMAVLGKATTLRKGALYSAEISDAGLVPEQAKCFRFRCGGGGGFFPAQLSRSGRVAG